MWKNDSENFVKFTGKQVWWSPFFNNLHFSLKRPQAQVFSWEFRDILQNSTTQWWLWWCWWLWIVPVEIVEQRKSLSLISSKDHCQRFSPSQNLSSGFVEWSFTVVITPTPWRHWCAVIETSFMKTWGAICNFLQTWFNKSLYQQCQKTTIKYDLVLQSAVLK